MISVLLLTVLHSVLNCGFLNNSFTYRAYVGLIITKWLANYPADRLFTLHRRVGELVLSDC